MISKEAYRKKIEDDIDFCNQHGFDYPSEVMAYLITEGKSYDYQKNIDQSQSQREMFEDFHKGLKKSSMIKIKIICYGLFAIMLGVTGYILIFLS